MTDAESSAIAWEWFANAHPHEAFDQDPDRFWELFHRQQPNVPRADMVALLEMTKTTPGPHGGMK